MLLCVCVCVCMRACVRACVRVCVCVSDVGVLGCRQGTVGVKLAAKLVIQVNDIHCSINAQLVPQMMTRHNVLRFMAS